MLLILLLRLSVSSEKKDASQATRAVIIQKNKDIAINAAIDLAIDKGTAINIAIGKNTAINTANIKIQL